MKFTGAKRVCGPCPFRDQCLRHPDRTPVRQVVFFTGRIHKTESHTERMKRKTRQRRRPPPLRAALCHRGAGVRQHPAQQAARPLHAYEDDAKVDTQWKLFCLVHNIEKLAHHGYAQ